MGMKGARFLRKPCLFAFVLEMLMQPLESVRMVSYSDPQNLRRTVRREGAATANDKLERLKLTGCVFNRG